MIRFPRFYKWGGHPVPYSWSFGWPTGKDKDLVCVRPDVIEDDPCSANWVLSPVGKTRVVALLGFALKYLLVALDRNVRGVSYKVTR